MVHEITKLQRTLGIPTTLKAFGADMDQVAKLKGEIIEAAMNDICTATNPLEVTEKDFGILFDKLAGK